MLEPPPSCDRLENKAQDIPFPDSEAPALADRPREAVTAVLAPLAAEKSGLHKLNCSAQGLEPAWHPPR